MNTSGFMLPAPVQIALTAVAAVALFLLWRRVTRVGGRAALIITAGFLLRALAGQALFWISWLHLPIARSLQLGGGFWFFALDGPGYLSWADLFARGTLHLDYPSRFFVQVFGVFVALFGPVASTVLLLNLAAYLATCAVIVAIARHRPSGALFFSLAAVSFGPSAVLWSLQPLKDTLFMLLVTLLILVSAWWKEARLAGAVAIVALAYGISSLRWYFAIFVLCAWAVFALWTVLTAPRRLRAALAAVVVFALSLVAIWAGGRYDMPPLRFWRHSLVGRLADIGYRFGTVPGATTIRPGPRGSGPGSPSGRGRAGRSRSPAPGRRARSPRGRLRTRTVRRRDRARAARRTTAGRRRAHTRRRFDRRAPVRRRYG